MKNIKENHKKCLVCKKLFEKKINCSRKNWGLTKFCSKQCQLKGRVYLNPRYSFPKGNEPWNKGLLGVCCNTGRTHIKKGQHISPTTEFKKGQTSPWKGKPNPHFAGANNPRWKGGVYPEHLKERHSDRMRKLRLEVFKRDNYTCKFCGRKRIPGDRVILNIHHKKSFAIHKELRFNMKNIITLCSKCHKITDSYGKNL